MSGTHTYDVDGCVSSPITTWEGIYSPVSNIRCQTVSVKQANASTSGLGVCPLCGGSGIEGKKGYGCSNWRDTDGGCRFVIWKTIARKKITESMAKTLLRKGITRELKGFKSNAGKKFNTRLKIEDGKVMFD